MDKFFERHIYKNQEPFTISNKTFKNDSAIGLLISDKHFVSCFFEGFVFDSTKFEDCTFNECVFRECSFQQAVFCDTRIALSIFNKCMFWAANIDEGEWGNSVFIDCHLVSMLFDGSYFADCHISGGSLYGTILDRCLVNNTDVTNVEMTKLTVENSLIDTIEVILCSLCGAYFCSSTIKDVQKYINNESPWVQLGGVSFIGHIPTGLVDKLLARNEKDPITIIEFVGVNFGNLVLLNKTVTSIRFCACNFMSSIFIDSTFTKVEFSNCVFTDITIQEISAIKAEFPHCTFTECTVADSDFGKSEFL